MLGLTVRAAFDPCTNLQAGATILGADYRNAAQHFGTGQYALRRAIGAYNSGSLYAGQDYVNEILAAAGLAPETGYVPDIQAATGSESGSLPRSRVSRSFWNLAARQRSPNHVAMSASSRFEISWPCS